MSIVKLLHDYEVNGSIGWRTEEFGAGDRRREFTVMIDGTSPAGGLADWRAVEDWCWSWLKGQEFEDAVPEHLPVDHELEAAMTALISFWSAGRLSWQFDNDWHAELGNGNGPEHILESHSPPTWHAMREWLLTRALGMLAAHGGVAGD